MKTLQVRVFGKPTTAPELIEAAPLEPGAGRVLVALEAAPINPSDLMLITGRYGVRPPLPAALGAEGVGRIVAVGPTVDLVRIGERILIVHRARLFLRQRLAIFMSRATASIGAPSQEGHPRPPDVIEAHLES